MARKLQHFTEPLWPILCGWLVHLSVSTRTGVRSSRHGLGMFRVQPNRSSDSSFLPQGKFKLEAVEQLRTGDLHGVPSDAVRLCLSLGQKERKRFVI